MREGRPGVRARRAGLDQDLGVDRVRVGGDGEASQGLAYGGSAGVVLRAGVGEGGRGRVAVVPVDEVRVVRSGEAMGCLALFTCRNPGLPRLGQRVHVHRWPVSTKRVGCTREAADTLSRQAWAVGANAPRATRQVRVETAVGRSETETPWNRITSPGAAMRGTPC
jgi:hypothetical protein